MDKDRQAFLQRLVATFRVEAEEHIDAWSAALLQLEQAKGPEEQARWVETAFREAHSLKGGARAVGQGPIESLCQAAENLLSAFKHRQVGLSPPLLDLLLASADCLKDLLAGLGGETPEAARGRAADLAERLDEAAAGAPPAPGPPAPPEEAAAQAPPPEAHPPEERLPPLATVRIAAARLDALLFQAEGLLTARLTARQLADDLRQIRESFAHLERGHLKSLSEVRRLQRSRRRAGRRADPRQAAKAAAGLDRLLDYFAREEPFVRDFRVHLETLAKAAEQSWRNLGAPVDALLDDVKKLSMVPLSRVVEILPKVARDIARQQGKEVEFAIVGGEVEMDRRILEELRDPLIHLVRNSVDHGIEPPEARLAAGKPRRGSITLSASQIESGRIEIRLADDGAGIDRARLRSAAARLGLAPAADEGDDAELLSLLFQSGVSTSAAVTDISGRGLGLAIVREKVERLGGAVGVASRPQAGTTFSLALPLTLATFRGVQVRVAGEDFIFPTRALEQVARVPRERIGRVNQRQILRFAGRAVPLVRLADVLELSAGAADESAAVAVVIAGVDTERTAFMVDEVVAELEVLVKPLGRQLLRVRHVGGATVLGNGRVVPILYVPDLLRSARAAGAGAGPAPAAAPPRPVHSVLVADDSITSRMLLKGILEAAGYRVATAVDGMDAYTRLSAEPFDLVVSDVDMPRLSGFDLTARIRADPRLSKLPVVLVTTLASPQARERGVQVGADAYIIKGDFEQSDLLEAIRRLL